MSDINNSSSPRWSSTVKIVVGLAFVAFVAWLLISFSSILGPLLLTFILAYLIYPLAEGLHLKGKLPWRLAVTLVYLIVIVIVIGLLTWGGLALLQQVQNLVYFLQNIINGIPNFINQLIANPIKIGLFKIDLTHLDLVSLSNQLLGIVQTLLSRVGSLVGTLAASAATTIGWLIFIGIVSYFILTETQGKPEQMINIHIPGYDQDLQRMKYELGRIWNAFLRNQLIVFTMTVLFYTAFLGLMGVNYYFGLALIGGLARFVPYVGPIIAWASYGLVAYFQGSTIFGLSSIVYAILIVGIAYLVDNTIDSFITPRLMANTLKVHPAAVLIAAIIGANLMGLIGVVLAAPVVATLKLLLDYILRKLFDMDPWEELKSEQPETPSVPLKVRLRYCWSIFIGWMHKVLRINSS
ncbi:MAG TPA: AI-2E family transporter [Anaerolineaceae bacterium]|nr:AI-2E family transporter [Anaerolineaceae bacterium]